MKKLLCAFVALLLLMACAIPASAANGKVTYDGNSQKFIFHFMSVSFIIFISI